MPRALTTRHPFATVAAMPSPGTPAQPASEADFEQSLDELERIVQRLERGEMPLDESLATFERGMALYRQCQTRLEQAELKVRQLLDPSNPASARPLDADTP